MRRSRKLWACACLSAKGSSVLTGPGKPGLVYNRQTGGVMMDQVFNLIGNYLFPIAMCVLVWLQSTKSQDKLIEQITVTIQANTAAMTANAKALEELQQTIERRMQ